MQNFISAAALDNTRRDDVNALVRDIGVLDALIDTSGFYVKGDWMDGGAGPEDAVAMARALKAIDHPAVLNIVAVGTLPDGRPYLAADFIDGQLLSSRIGRAGAMHFNEARPMLEAIAEGLDKVHAAGIMHSDLRTEHVMLVRRDNHMSGVLTDFAVDRLAHRSAGEMDSSSLLLLIGSAKSLAPERARTGAPADVKSDVYAFGTLVYEVLTGKPAFTGATPIDLIVAHVTQTPEVPSKVAPRGWVPREVDAVVLRAMAQDPAERFGSATEFVRALGDALKGRRTGDITREEFDTRKKSVLDAPGDDEKALQLEAAGNQGIPWEDVFAALKDASEKTDDAGQIKSLLYRAARVAQLEIKNLSKAREAYDQIFMLDDKDEIARSKIAEIRLAMATPEEKAEILLENAEKETLHEKRAEILRELGALYEKQLKDTENALVAYSEALAAVPLADDTGRDIERLCGDDATKWSETLKHISEAIDGKEPSHAAAIMVRSGRWYAEKLSRPDFAVACFTRALSLEPGNDAALDGAGQIYRKAQQWAELVAILLRRADAQASPGRAREIRAEAADVLDGKLSDARRARDLLEKILKEDPAQPKATQILERIYIAADDWTSLVALLEKKAEALTSSAKSETYSEIAETYEDRLKNDAKAAAFYEKAAEIDPKNIAALKGLERLYARLGQHDKMLRTLELQVAAAATPRQKVDL
ncbi:MAG: protein kinase, partial [Deltaproteobacteria bacterium]